MAGIVVEYVCVSQVEVVSYGLDLATFGNNFYQQELWYKSIVKVLE
jgi:hypothetical protein